MDGSILADDVLSLAAFCYLPSSLSRPPSPLTLPHLPFLFLSPSLPPSSPPPSPSLPLFPSLSHLLPSLPLGGTRGSLPLLPLPLYGTTSSTRAAARGT